MKGIIVFNIIISIMISLCQAGIHDKFTVKDSSTINKELSFTGTSQPKTVEVDNVFGKITVTGYYGNTAKFTIQKTIFAYSQDAMQRAKNEVILDITTEGNTIIFYVDGPFRNHKAHHGYNERGPDYIVQYDFQVQVPRNTSLYLKTVNDGDIVVNDIEEECTLKNVNGDININTLRGDFEVTTVNGEIQMKGIDGAGNANTVNGEISLQFSNNPTSDCSFESVNGDLELVFLPGLSAEFRLNTFNGKIRNEFASEDQQASSSEIKMHHGKHMLKHGHGQSQKISMGRGGPDIDLSTLNGDITLSK